jgi:Oxidoreductase family, NAD-binding Rossmann fold
MHRVLFPCRPAFPLLVLALVAAHAPAQTAAPRLPRDNLLVYRGPNDEPRPVRMADDWLRRRAEILRGMQAVMGTLPGPEKRCPLDMQVEEEVDCGPYVRRRITYASEPGSRVPAYLCIPKAALQPDAKPVPAVLCLHGTDNTVGHGIVVGLGNRPNRAYAAELAERGYVTLAPNYPLLAKYQPDLKALGWESGTLKAVWDNIRGLDLLESLPFIKKGAFGAIGHSLGGHNSVFTAVFDDRIRAVVTSCGLDSFLDYYRGDEKVWLPEKGWTQTRYMPRLAGYRNRLPEIPFDFHELIGALAPRHVLIVAPLKDSNFRSDSVDRIAAAARPVYELYGQPGRLRVEHPDCEHDFPQAMRAAAYALFDTVLLGPAQDAGPRELRAGMIGLDTSHVIAFAQEFNKPKPLPELAGIKIVAGYPGGTDFPPSATRVKKFTEQLRGMGVEIVDSIPALLKKVDVVLLESVDGRPHLEQVLPVLQAGKPVFIDKPVAASLKDTLAIFEAARRRNVPVFSSSSLRFLPGPQQVRAGKVGAVLGCDTYGPCPIEPDLPDLFWYGIHGVEALFTCLGPGCESVTRVASQDFDLVVGRWKDGRLGSFRGLRRGKIEAGGTAFGTDAVLPFGRGESGYRPLLVEIAKFFRTGKPPVSAEETIEVVAFLEAADESKRRGGAPVTLADMLAKAKRNHESHE